MTATQANVSKNIPMPITETGEIDPSAFVFDFTNVGESKSFEAIPAGTYAAQIKTAVFKFSQSGNPMINLTWLIEEGEYKGRTIFDRLMFIPPSGDKRGTLWRVRAVCEALGVDYPMMRVASREEFVEVLTGLADSVLGQYATIKVKKSYDDRQNPETGKPYGDKNEVEGVKAYKDVSLNSLFG
jgi:hypothetical protein